MKITLDREDEDLVKMDWLKATYPHICEFVRKERKREKGKVTAPFQESEDLN
jgi:hypothetical protein